MAITITSREFNQKASQVLKMSEKEPVFITKWGKIVGVLSNYKTYQQSQLSEPDFEELFAPEKSVESDFFDSFEQKLSDIRRSTTLRAVDFE